MMGDDKSAQSLSPMGSRDRDLELLIPFLGDSDSGGSPLGDDDVDKTASSSASAALSSSGREVRPSRLPVIVSPRVFSDIQLQFWFHC
jgi:hypothetical protein